MTAPGLNIPVSGDWAGSFDDLAMANAAAQQAEVPKPVEPTTVNPMAIVIPFIEREREQVLRLLAFILKLSGKPLSRALYLVPFKGLKIDDVLTAARAAFADVQVIADGEGVVSNWKKGDKVRDAAGPNSLFRQAAWHFLLSKPPAGPWLWLEPDCVPMVSNWHDAIEAAYRSFGKPFLGARMKFSDGSEYLNGVAVYPQDAVNRAPALVTRTMWTNFPDLEIAFDVAGGAEVLRQATLTKLIAFEPADGAVLVHGDRDGKILEKLLSGVRASGDGPRRSNAGDGPMATKCGAAQKSSKRKRGDAKCDRRKSTGSGTATIKDVTVQSNGAEKFDPESAPVSIGGVGLHGIKCTCLDRHFPCPFHFRDNEPTIGDQMRAAVATLEGLATNSNRRTRILKLLRKTALLPRIAR